MRFTSPTVYSNRRIIVFDSETGTFKRMWVRLRQLASNTNLAPYNPADPPSQVCSGIRSTAYTCRATICLRLRSSQQPNFRFLTKEGSL